MVGMARFERATPASRTQCPTKLGHIPTRRVPYITCIELSIFFLLGEVMNDMCQKLKREREIICDCLRS